MFLRSSTFCNEKNPQIFLRRKHGMGLLGKVMRKRRLTRRMPESSRSLMVMIILMILVTFMLLMFMVEVVMMKS